MNVPRAPDRIKREHTVANELTSRHCCECDQCDHPEVHPEIESLGVNFGRSYIDWRNSMLTMDALW